MGAYQIFHINFKTKKARDIFETCHDKLKYDGKATRISKPKRLFQYKWDDKYECTYYMGWDGYGLSRMCLDYLNQLNLISEIKEFKSLDLSCVTNWYNDLKEYKRK